MGKGGLANPQGNVQVSIAGPDGFERQVQFRVDDELAEITERVRATVED